MRLLNVRSNDDSCNKQALETELTQLKDTVTSLKIQNDGYKVTNENLNRCYEELSKANTYLRTTSLEKIAAQKAEIATLNAKTVGNKSSGTTKPVNPKVIASGMYAISPKDGKLVVEIVLWYLDSGCSRHMTGDRLKVVEIVLWYLDSGCSRHMTGDRSKLGDTIISRVYYVEGLNHNLFSVGQFCDGGLEVAFRKSKKESHPLKMENTNVEVLSTLHMDLYGPMRTESINKKKYVLVIVDDYTRFGWVRFLRTKDETLKVFLKFLKNTQRALNATVCTVRIDNGMEFVNKTLTGLFESVGITHQTSVPRSLQQNGIVERRNQTLMEAARTMLIFAKAPLFLWAEAVATTCYTLNRYLIHTLHEKTYYELLKGKKPDLKYFRIFDSLCYPTNDYDNVGKLKAKADIGIFVGYAPTKKAYRVYNKRTRKIQETVHVTFDELSRGMTFEHVSSGLSPNSTTSVQNSTGFELNTLQSGRTSSDLVKDPPTPSVSTIVQQFDELFQPWIDEDEEFPPTPTAPVNAPAV
nr:hypothetical protein [Tanacetum cinerariifolium]